MTPISTNTAVAVLERAVDANVPTVLWGPPGIGKTARVTQLCAGRGWHVEVVVAATRQPDDFAGLPWIHDSVVSMVPPDWARRLLDVGQRGEIGVLFLDEISCVPPSTSSALLRVILERVVGDLTLPPTTRVIAAANPPEQAAGGWDLPPALSNRLFHLGWPTPAPTEWQQWALSTNSGLPAVGAALVASFLSRFPALLLDVPANEAAAGLAWPSPRSWAQAAKLVGDGAASIAVEFSCLYGCVGEAAAAQFGAWRALATDLPDPHELLEHPDRWSPPVGRPDVLHAVLSAVVAHAVSDLTRQRWDAAWQILLATVDQAPDVVLGTAQPLVEARGARTTELPAPIDPRLGTVVALMDLLESAQTRGQL